jgi:hypothetical protein
LIHLVVAAGRVDSEALRAFVGRYRLVDPDIGDGLVLRFLVAGDIEPGALDPIEAAASAASAR